jgi:hypothetical protein
MVILHPAHFGGPGNKTTEDKMIKFYGTDTETIAVTNRGIFLVQSVDFYRVDEHEELGEIPKEFEELDPALCTDIIIPEECK